MIASTQSRPLRRPTTASRRGRPQKYPWDQWVTARRPIQLFRFIDYEVESRNFAMSLRAAFSARGVRVRVTIDDDFVFVEDKS